MLRILKQLFCAISLCAFLATPSQAMFIQSDWYNPTEPGVGTNRYAYSFNDPINKFDPGGNEVREVMGFFGGMLDGFLGALRGDFSALGPSTPQNQPFGHTGLAIGTEIDSALGLGISRSEGNPFGQETHGGKLGIDLPSPEDIANAPDEELRDYIGLVGESLEQRKKELEKNLHGLPPKEKKRYKTKIANEEKSRERAEAELGLREALAGEKEGPSNEGESEGEGESDER